MTTVSEIAPDLFRISTFVPDFNLQFNQFLVRDAEPLLFHTGPRGMFAAVRDAVATVLDPRTVRWIGFSHVEADECGSLPEWQALAPQSTAVCSLVGKLVSVDDCVATRPALGMKDGEVLSTGKYRFRFCIRRTYRTAGKRGCCLKRPSARCSVRTSFIKTGMLSRRRARTCWAGAGRCWWNTSRDRWPTICRILRSLSPHSIGWLNCSRRRWRRCMVRPILGTVPVRSAIWQSCSRRCWGRGLV